MIMKDTEILSSKRKKILIYKKTRHFGEFFYEEGC